ncbi:hypothetical protein XAUB_02870 [Xanthomonas citri pv. aurantifolii str. ICPB 11122]|nr:hypothetical protein XAUB_02870 [Xanthomonas citri pv. aurantifolii str. ICPB 11122]
MCDQRTVGTVLRGLRSAGGQHRRLQHGGSDDQPVLRDVVGHRRLLRQHVPATVGVALADALHLFAVAPGRGDQHIAAEAAAPHRLHGVIQVASRRADFDLHRSQLGLGFGHHLAVAPTGALQRGQLRIAHLVGDGFGLATGVAAQITRHVLAAEHRAGGHVNGVQHLLPTLRRHRIATQQAAAELVFGIVEALGQVRCHRIAHAPAQVGLPLVRLDADDHAVELLEHGRVGHRHQVVLDALRFQEVGQAQVLVLLAQFLGGDRCVVVERVVDALHRLRATRQRGFDLQHGGGVGVELVGGGAGERQDLLDVGAVAAHQRLGVGVGAGVEGRVWQAHAALHEVADMAIERLQVHVRAEIEADRNADLMQRGDGSGHILGLLDRVDAREQGGDRVGAVLLDRRFVQAAGPEIAKQLLHVALRGLHRCVEQLALLLQGALGQLTQRGDGAGLRHGVGLEPAGVGVVVEIGAGGRDGRRLGRRGLLLASGVGVGGGQQRDQAEAKSEGKRTNGGHREEGWPD